MSHPYGKRVSFVMKETGNEVKVIATETTNQVMERSGTPVTVFTYAGHKRKLPEFVIRFMLTQRYCSWLEMAGILATHDFAKERKISIPNGGEKNGLDTAKV